MDVYTIHINPQEITASTCQLHENAMLSVSSLQIYKQAEQSQLSGCKASSSSAAMGCDTVPELCHDRWPILETLPAHRTAIDTTAEHEHSDQHDGQRRRQRWACRRRSGICVGK